MKNIILHMLQFEESDRIAVHAMHSSLIDLSERIYNSTSFTILQSLDEDK